MTLSIGRGPRPEASEDDPFAPLLACHARIRRFSSLATELLRHTREPSHEAREAARETRRYFTEALPRHVEDEDQDLTRALLSAGASDATRAALLVMTAEHDEIERTLARLAPPWAALGSGDSLDAEAEQALCADTSHLTRLLEAHLTLEETQLFPEARARLDAAQKASLARAMRARRAAGA